MTKKELVKYIEQNRGESESWGILNKMKKDELEKIYNYLEKVRNIEKVVEKEEETPKPVEFDFPKETFLGQTDSNKPVKIDILPKVKNDGQEYITIDKKPSNLSIAEQRAYIRSGILPKIKVKKYDRFDKEDVKFGF
jgi:hypothetical protein